MSLAAKEQILQKFSEIKYLKPREDVEAFLIGICVPYCRRRLEGLLEQPTPAKCLAVGQMQNVDST